MTDDILDPRFERDLRAVLAETEPADAPASLYSFVAGVPGRVPTSRTRASRMALAGLSMAAVVVIAITALAIVLPPLGNTPPVGGQASPAPSNAATLRIEYSVAPVNGVTPGADDMEVIATILRNRIESTGVAKSSVFVAGDRIVVDLAVDPAAEDVTSQLRALLGTTGRLDFVPLGDTPSAEGATVDLTRYPPLFSGDQVSKASIGSDQTGSRTIDFTLRAEGKQKFAAYTAQNVGTYFAIVLDGQAISVPVIKDSIPNGQVQITPGALGGFSLAEAQNLVTIVQFGQLPFPIVEVSNNAGPTARP
jgi:preprotein translocase subunit SecD